MHTLRTSPASVAVIAAVLALSPGCAGHRSSAGDAGAAAADADAAAADADAAAADADAATTRSSC